jgi:hypothetical protein
MIAQPTTAFAGRLRELEAAFDLEDSYDVLVVLQRLTQRKRAALGLEFSELSYPERLVSYILWFHTDIANGLLEQFFLSERGVYALAIRDALEVIGATSNHRILDYALSVFPLSRPATGLALRRQQVAVLSRTERLLLSALDRAYAYESEDAPTLAVEYLTPFKADFV